MMRLGVDICGLSDEEMERFYQDLSQAVKQVPKGDMLLVMGDFNAKGVKTVLLEVYMYCIKQQRLVRV